MVYCLHSLVKREPHVCTVAKRRVEYYKLGTEPIEKYLEADHVKGNNNDLTHDMSLVPPLR